MTLAFDAMKQTVEAIKAAATAAAANKPIDYEVKPYNNARLKATEVKIASYMGDIFTDMDGEYDKETGVWSGDRGGITEAVSNIGRRAIPLSIGGQPVRAEELEFIAIDIMKLDKDSFFKENSTSSWYIPGDDANEFDYTAYNQKVNWVITQVLNTQREANAYNTNGEYITTLDVWPRYKVESELFNGEK